MKKDFINNIKKGCVKWSKGFDYCRLNFKEENLKDLEYFTDKINNLDFDNSNFWGFELWGLNISVIKIQADKGIAGIFSISYQWFSVPLFSILQFSKHNQELLKSFGSITYYGSYFRLQDVWFIKEDFKKELNKTLLDLWITRVDYRFDIFFNDDKKKIFLPQDITKLRANSKIDYRTTWGNIESWLLGSRKNKKYLIRAYDKLLDTNKKGKFFLYKDYFKYKKVYRLEFEFLNHFCKWYTLRDLDKLNKKIENFLNVKKDNKLFEGVEDVNIEDVKDRFKYFTSLKAYIKWCIKNEINIFWAYEEVLKELWYKEEQIEEQLIDFIKRKKLFYGNWEKKEDLKLYDLIK